MLFYEVNTKAELKAAIQASAQVSFEAAKANPVQIHFGTCKYRFPNGVRESRAKQLVREINHGGAL